VARTPGPPDFASWPEYAAVMAAHDVFDGWTFCRFGIRGPGEYDNAFVFGVVRNPFGAWWAPFDCRDAATGYQVQRLLACLEHTRSGIAIGVFGDMELAIEAAELAARLGDWRLFDINQAASMELFERTQAAWHAAGIIRSSFVGSPKGRTDTGPIFIKHALADLARRPEHLSS
jgi:hypothetical protein